MPKKRHASGKESKSTRIEKERSNKKMPRKPIPRHAMNMIAYCAEDVQAATFMLEEHAGDAQKVMAAALKLKDALRWLERLGAQTTPRIRA